MVALVVTWLILAQAVSVAFTQKLNVKTHMQATALAPDTPAPLMRQVAVEPEAAPAPLMRQAATEPEAAPKQEQQDAGAQAHEISRYHAFVHALRGGLAGMVTGAFQVLCLMWLRTATNHQSYHGGSLSQTVSTLWAAGGIPRFYQGVTFALLQVPAARFGDSFAESATFAMLGDHGQQLPGFMASVAVATLGSAWRLLISPLDTLKTTAQVHGVGAKRALELRTQHRGTADLWSGATASFIIIWVSTYPWWAVYNTVLEYWSEPIDAGSKLVRNGVAGVLASMASDLTSNSLRVLKIMRAANMDAAKGGASEVGYLADAKAVLEKDGLAGLLFRGLSARMLTGACQGAFFSIFWNLLLGSETDRPSPAVLESETDKQMAGTYNASSEPSGFQRPSLALSKSANNITRQSALIETHRGNVSWSSSWWSPVEGRVAALEAAINVVFLTCWLQKNLAVDLGVCSLTFSHE